MQRPIHYRGIQFFAAAVCWLALQLTPAVCRAGVLAGADDPVLQAAIETWLRDDDRNSLPVFAELAATGNIAARLLLARIEDTERAAGEFVNGLSRKERVAMFRSDSGKGVFRPSWLKTEAQQGNQLASELLRASALEVDIAAIERLFQIGEVEATYDLIRQVAANGSAGEKDRLAEVLPPTSDLAPYLQALRTETNPGLAALQITIAGMETVDANPDAATEAAATFVEWGYLNGIQNVDFDPANRYYADLAAWIGSATSMAPIAGLCRKLCDADGFQACTVNAFGLVGGYYKAIHFDSPLEALIEQSRYVESERASGMLLRRISSLRNASGSPLVPQDELRRRSACLADAVEARSGG